MTLYYLIFRHLTLPIQRRVTLCAVNQDAAIKAAAQRVPADYKLWGIWQ